MKDVYDILNDLAKSNKYQTLYMLMKESGISFFENDTDFTIYQIYFINILALYYSIYHDIAMDYVAEEVIDDKIYVDAYIYYKRRNKGNPSAFGNNKEEVREDKTKTNEKNSFSWLMKHSTKKK